MPENKTPACEGTGDTLMTDWIMDAGWEANQAASSRPSWKTFATEAPVWAGPGTLFEEMYGREARATERAVEEETARRVCFGCPLFLDLSCVRVALTTATDAVQGAMTAADRIAVRRLLGMRQPFDSTALFTPLGGFAEGEPISGRAERQVAAGVVMAHGGTAADVREMTSLAERQINRVHGVVVALRAAAADDIDEKDIPKLLEEITDKHKMRRDVVADIAEQVLTAVEIDDVSDDDLARAVAEVLEARHTAPETPAAPAPARELAATA